MKRKVTVTGYKDEMRCRVCGDVPIPGERCMVDLGIREGENGPENYVRSVAHQDCLKETKAPLN